MHSPQQQQPQQWQQTYQQAPTPPPRRRMSPLKWSLIAVGVVVLLVAGLVVFATVVARVAGSLPSASATPNRTAEPATAPSPSAAEQRAYLATLKSIDPGLTVNTERVMRRAGRVCERILHGADGGTMTLEKYTVAELSGGNATISEAQAKQVIAAVKVWCKPV
ncbi:DUF732 domain-containing protein [Nonomuraea sp. NPDC026600]|uniref:DUF732 domain-containing protein n=1 Tax=Nonomuraea sp. NPDC026600 TaxID=3155363 RepID=UPI0033CDC8B4